MEMLHCPIQTQLPILEVNFAKKVKCIWMLRKLKLIGCRIRIGLLISKVRMKLNLKLHLKQVWLSGIKTKIKVMKSKKLDKLFQNLKNQNNNSKDKGWH
jgi:hypothetical protein